MMLFPLRIREPGWRGVVQDGDLVLFDEQTGIPEVAVPGPGAAADEFQPVGTTVAQEALIRSLGVEL